MSSANYHVLIGFVDWTDTQMPRISYTASRLRTINGFNYGDTTAVKRIWLALQY